MNRVPCILLCLLGLVNFYGVQAQDQQPDSLKIREGRHNFTLQWIGWDNPGKAQISKKSDGTYTIKGEQRNVDSAEFVTIDGTLKVLTPRELLFEGTIQSKINYLNKGEVCDRTGTYHFFAKGTRKYWRLQEMENCQGNNAVDYVDIFF